MRTLFPGYLKREPAEFTEIWNECIFSFDANFLLDFYRSTPELQKTLFRILKLVNDRSWLTHQAALEYYRNRETVIKESSEAYDKISALVKGASKNVENGLNKYQKHTAIEIDKIIELTKQTVTDVDNLLQELEEQTPRPLEKRRHRGETF